MLNKILSRQIENKEVFHSYIFEGDREKTFEQYESFSKLLLNTSSDINNTVQIISSQTNNISIDEIRMLNKMVYERPSEFDYNIYIIEDAHKMRDEAQNALLKTLEDLPSYSIVIMTTDNRYKLLNTIISRSQVITTSSQYEIDFQSNAWNNTYNVLQDALEKRYYMINKERQSLKELSDDKLEVLHILTKVFTDAYFQKQEKNIKYNQLVEKLSTIQNTYLEEILLRIEKIKELTKVNINFQLALEDLIFLIMKAYQE